MMKNPIFELENGGSTYTRVNTVEVFSHVRAWGNNLFFLQKGTIISHITISDSANLK